MIFINFGCTTDFSSKEPANTTSDGGSDSDTDVATVADARDDTGTGTNGDDSETALGVATDDADSVTDTGPAATVCTHEYGDFVGNEKRAVGTVAKRDNKDRVVVDVWETTPESTKNVWSYIEIEMWAPKLGETDLTIDKDIFELDNYVLFATDCVEKNHQEVCNKEFLATQGTLTVTELNPDQPWLGNLSFTITNLRLAELTVDWEAETFTWAEDGETVCVDSWSYDGSVSKL